MSDVSSAHRAAATGHRCHVGCDCAAHVELRSPFDDDNVGPRSRGFARSLFDVTAVGDEHHRRSDLGTDDERSGTSRETGEPTQIDRRSDHGPGNPDGIQTRGQLTTARVDVQR